MMYLRVLLVVLAVAAAGCSGGESGAGTDADSGSLPVAGANGGSAGAGSGASGNGAAGFGVGTAGATAGSTAGSTAGTEDSGADGGIDGAIAAPGDAGDGDASMVVGNDAAMGDDAAVGGDMDAGTDASVSADAGMDAGMDAAVSVDPWPPVPTAPELLDLPNDYATAICKALADCVLPTYYEFAYDGPACEARVAAQLQDGEYVFLQASIDAGRVAFDVTKLQGCYDAVAALSCNVFTERSPAACGDALTGKVAKGAACVIDSDCVADTFCDRSIDCPGVCANLLAEDALCDRSDQCGAGMQCSGGTCRTPAITGENCDAGGAPPCALGNLCVGADADADTAGKCVDQATAFSLDADEQCDPSAGQWCKDGLACVVDRAPGGTETDLIAVCKARVAADAACNFSFAPEQCPPEQYCPADLNPSYKDTCTARPAAGQSCGLYGVCAPGLRCKSGKCQGPARIGDACANAGECASGRCRLNVCAAPSRCRLDAAGPQCGDDACDSEAETCSNCPADCGACPAVCGNTSCESGENCESCSQDCGACPDVCGDDTCDPTENCTTCASDCGACPAPYSACSETSACGPGKTCAEQSVSTLPLLPPVNYGYCAETCSTATTCSGSAGQRICSSGHCALQCDALLGVLDPNRRCPLGMQCVSNLCTWLQ